MTAGQVDVTIQSSESGSRLRFSNRRVEDNGPDFAMSADVALDISGMHAQKTVYFWRNESIIQLFEQMAENWRGWKGEKTAGSIEEDLTLRCTSDSLGHGFLRVVLVDYDDNWKAEGTLRVEGGQYETIAKQLKRFLSREQS